MSINASGSNYMSNVSILAWMEIRTDDIYGKMRDAMDSSNARAHAEDKLNEIKAKILECKTSDAAPEEVRQLINKAIEDYKDVPEVAEVLGDFAKNLNDQSKATSAAAERAVNELKTLPPVTSKGKQTDQGLIQRIRQLNEQINKGIVIRDEQVDAWSKAISDKVDGLGKQDQLGMINIQEFNAQLNQAKQTASALMDAADKSANSIISHIS